MGLHSLAVKATIESAFDPPWDSKMSISFRAQYYSYVAIYNPGRLA